MRRPVLIIALLLGASTPMSGEARASSATSSESDLAVDIAVAWANARITAFNAMSAPSSEDRRWAALDMVTGAQADGMASYLDAMAAAGAWLDEQDWSRTWFSVHAAPHRVDSPKGEIAALVCEVSMFVIVHRGMVPGDPPLLADVGSSHFKAWFTFVDGRWKLSKMKQIPKFRGGTSCGDPALGPVTIIPTSHIEVTSYP